MKVFFTGGKISVTVCLRDYSLSRVSDGNFGIIPTLVATQALGAVGHALTFTELSCELGLAAGRKTNRRSLAGSPTLPRNQFVPPVNVFIRRRHKPSCSRESVAILCVSQACASFDDTPAGDVFRRFSGLEFGST